MASRKVNGMGIGGVAVVTISATDHAAAPGGEAVFSIGELAREYGVTQRALRFYEEEGLIAPRRDGAARIYSRRDHKRIALILRGKAIGFSLDEIGELLDLYEPSDGGAAQRQAALAHCDAKAATLQQQKASIQAMLDELGQFASSLRRGCP